MKGSGRLSFIIILILGIAGIVLAYMLAQDFYFGEIYKKTGDKLSVFTELSRSVCGEGSSYINCARVSSSKYARLLGVPNAIWGLLFFMVVSFIAGINLFLSQRMRELTSFILFWLLLVGSIFDIILLLISVIVLEAICSLCFATYLVNWVSLGVIIVFHKKRGLTPLNPGSLISELLNSHKGEFLKKYIPTITLTVLISSITVFAANSRLSTTRNDFIDRMQKTAIKQILREFPNQKVVDVNPSGMLLIGDQDAPVTIVEFSDFLCPYCSKAAEVLESLIKENRRKVRLLFMNYPLDKNCNVNMKNQVHPGACVIALGSISAAKQGMFKEFHDTAFRLKPENPGRKEIEKLAAIAGLNVELFFRDMASMETQNELVDQLKRGWDLKVNGTPTLYINGKLFRYRPVKELLQGIIDQEYQSSMAKDGKK